VPDNGQDVETDEVTLDIMCALVALHGGPTQLTRVREFNSRYQTRGVSPHDWYYLLAKVTQVTATAHLMSAYVKWHNAYNGSIR